MTKFQKLILWLLPKEIDYAREIRKAGREMKQAVEAERGKRKVNRR